MNAFINHPKQPTDRELATALGPAKRVWSLRVKRKARTIVWLSPEPGRCTVLFILGAKAMRAARQAKFPARVVKVMDESPKHPEGTGIRLAVKTAKDAKPILRLAEIKSAN